MKKIQFEESPGEYAIFQSGGKQYQALKGKTLALEKLDVQVGETVVFNDVLLRRLPAGTIEIGQPFLTTPLHAVVVKHNRAPKVTVFKFKRRKDYRVKQGHRQEQTIVRFESV